MSEKSEGRAGVFAGGIGGCVGAGVGIAFEAVPELSVRLGKDSE
jgi:hypothetical protein